MSGPSKIDLVVWSGDNWPPVVWGFGEPDAHAIPTDARFELELSYGRDKDWSRAVLTSPIDLVIDLSAGTVSWRYEASLVSAMLYRSAGYSLRCILPGSIQTWAFGSIEIQGIL